MIIWFLVYNPVFLQKKCQKTSYYTVKFVSKDQTNYAALHGDLAENDAKVGSDDSYLGSDHWIFSDHDSDYEIDIEDTPAVAFLKY